MISAAVFLAVMMIAVCACGYQLALQISFYRPVAVSLRSGAHLYAGLCQRLPRSFTDASAVSGWAKDAVIWALENGIIEGVGDGMLKPQASATRAQVAAILQRFLSL